MVRLHTIPTMDAANAAEMAAMLPPPGVGSLDAETLSTSRRLWENKSLISLLLSEVYLPEVYFSFV
jgi:hypothetical protein